MPATQLAGRDVELNKHGHLADFDAWDRELAQALAAAEGLALEDSHWIVLDFLREYYDDNDFAPSPRVILREIGERLARPGLAAKRRDLEALFPNGGCKQACRLAGLPDYFCHAC